MLDTITQGMGHASLYKDIESDADIDAALLALFKDVVDYCIQATEFFGRSAFSKNLPVNPCALLIVSTRAVYKYVGQTIQVRVLPDAR